MTLARRAPPTGRRSLRSSRPSFAARRPCTRTTCSRAITPGIERPPDEGPPPRLTDLARHPPRPRQAGAQVLRGFLVIHGVQLRSQVVRRLCSRPATHCWAGASEYVHHTARTCSICRCSAGRADPSDRVPSGCRGRSRASRAEPDVRVGERVMSNRPGSANTDSSLCLSATLTGPRARLLMLSCAAGPATLTASSTIRPANKGSQMTWKRLRRWFSGLFQSKRWTGEPSSQASRDLHRNVDEARTQSEFRFRGRW